MLKQKFDEFHHSNLARKLQAYNVLGNIKTPTGMHDTRKDLFFGKKVIKLVHNAIEKSPDLMKLIKEKDLTTKH